MTVVLTSGVDCILDHYQALINAYRQCIFSASPTVSQLCMNEDKEDEHHQIRVGSSLCLDHTSHCQHSCIDGASQRGIAVSEGGTGILSEDGIAISEHFVQSSPTLSKEPLDLSDIEQHRANMEPRTVGAGLTQECTCVSSDAESSSIKTCSSNMRSQCKSNVEAFVEKQVTLELLEAQCKTNQVPGTCKKWTDEETSESEYSLPVVTGNDTACHDSSMSTGKHRTDNTAGEKSHKADDLSSWCRAAQNQSDNVFYDLVLTDSVNKQRGKTVICENPQNKPVNEIVTKESKTASCDSWTDEQKRETENNTALGNTSAGPDCLQTAPTGSPKPKRVSLRLKRGFFTVKVPYMMDSQFLKVNGHFSQEKVISGEYKRQIGVADIQQVLQNQSKRRKRKLEKTIRNSEEERLHSVHISLAHLAREQEIFLKHIALPLDNNLLSRQCARLDQLGDVFTPLLMTAQGSSLLHMGDCLQPLVITAHGEGSTKFSASELIHRQVSYKSAEASVVEVDNTSYVLPPRSAFLISNLQDFCDHLYLEIVGDGYDLIVLDPPWENKSVKRKKSYDMMNEDGLHNLPLTRLAQDRCLIALWVTNNERLEDYALYTLLPLWGFTAVAKWYWLKVTQTGDMISNMDGHKKPYEILLLGRKSGSSDAKEEGRELPKTRMMMSVPCSLHSKKPPLADVLQPYLPSNPKCLELFARNLWPGWTSWGREVLKHQNLMFYEAIDHSH